MHAGWSIYILIVGGAHNTGPKLKFPIVSRGKEMCRISYRISIFQGNSIGNSALTAHFLT